MNIERNEILQKWDEHIRHFRDDYNRWEKHTLADYIKKCVELLELQIEYKILEISKQQISSHLFHFLNEVENIRVSDQYIRDNVSDDYKRNYLKSQLSLDLKQPKWDLVTSAPELIEKNQFGKFRINGIEVIEKKESEPKHENFAEPRNEDEYSKLLLIFENCASTIERTLKALRESYFADEKNKKTIQQRLGYDEYKTEDALKLLAQLQNSKSLLDDRNKWGDYEKMMMNFLIKTGETTAHLAKAVGYCSKYGSIGIEREESVNFANEELRLFLRTCPICKTDIANELNQDFINYKLGKKLKITVPKIIL